MISKNASRFINAYNNVDYALRIQNDLKRSLNYADVVRRSVPLNSVVRKYEDDLIDFGRLRNAIVHSNSENNVMAEPLPEVVDKFEQIARLITAPPKVLDCIVKKEVLCVDRKASVEKVVELIAKSGYSNIPVYADGALIGVANNGKILNIIGEWINKQENVCDKMKITPIGNLVSKELEGTYYSLANKDVTAEQVLSKFNNNRKLLVVIVTKSGDFVEEPLGIISSSDFLEITRKLENY